MHAPRRHVAAFALVVACAQAAAVAAGGTSPCSLATKAEVTAAFGGTVGAGKVDNSLPGAPTCHFSVKGSNLGLSGEAVVFETPGQTPATFALAKKIVPGAISISGVGTAAFYNPRTTSIELLKRKVVASAQAIFLNPGGPEVSAVKVKADVVAFAKAVAKHV